RQAQLSDRLLVEARLEEIDQLCAAQQSIAEAHIEQADDRLPGKLGDPLLQPFQISVGVDCANQRADRGPAYHVRPDARVQQCPNHTDMRPAARRAATEGEGNARAQSLARHDHFTASSSTSNNSAASGGITLPAPFEPYASSA